MLLYVYYPENFVSWVKCFHEFFTNDIIMMEMEIRIEFPSKNIFFSTSLSLLQACNK